MSPTKTSLQESIRPRDLTPREVEREFHGLLRAGSRLEVAGSDRSRPEALLEDGYTPKHALRLFGHDFYFANVRQNPLLRFFVVWVAPPPPPRGPRRLHARIFYKDISLVWRTASHLIHTEDDLWIGKGDVVPLQQGEWIEQHTLEQTTDLPFEMQDAVESLVSRARTIRRDLPVLERVLRNAPQGRVQPYRDFTEPRRRAAARPGGLIHRGRLIARFRKRHDPDSLQVTPGFEPDFRPRGLIGRTSTHSKSLGGRIDRYRFLSRNRQVQWLFFAGPRLVWLAPPQALTTELSSYGVRTVDALVDDELCIPAYEYHFEEHPGEPDSLHSQIPPGFAGDPNPFDPDRADASPWIDRLPLVREFRKKVLKRSR